MPLSRSSTLGALRDAYLHHCQSRVRQDQLNASTLASYTRGLQRLDWLAERRLNTLRCPDVMRWYREISVDLTSAVAFGAYTALRVMIGWARRAGLCEANVAAGLQIVHAAKSATPVRPEELARLCAELDIEDAKRTKVAQRRGLEGLAVVAQFSATRVVRFLAGTGRRLSEGCNVLVDEVDLHGRCISLGKTKTGPSAVILSDAMLGLVAEQLRQLGGRSRYLWPSPANPDRPISKWAVSEAFGRLCGRARLLRKKPHGMRHGFAYASLSGGAGLYATGRLLGHRSIKTTQRVYSGGIYVTPDMHDAAAIVLSQHVSAGAVLHPTREVGSRVVARRGDR